MEGQCSLNTVELRVSLVVLLWSHYLNLYTILPPTNVNNLLNSNLRSFFFFFPSHFNKLSLSNPPPLQLNFGTGLSTISPLDGIVSNVIQYILSPIPLQVISKGNSVCHWQEGGGEERQGQSSWASRSIHFSRGAFLPSSHFLTGTVSICYQHTKLQSHPIAIALPRRQLFLEIPHGL